ncbi:MAG: carbon starvation protein A, partial [Clostridia bacterium]|nr:carbon starvation protein A [Clostridia bacterium]
CGITSGFHATQCTLIGRSVRSEKEGKFTFYWMMILEGFIAMIWAAAAMGVMKLGLANTDTAATNVCGIVAKDLLGNIGGIIALIGIIVLPITSGDTALRSLRLIVADTFKIDQLKTKNRLGLSGIIFALVATILIFAKMNPKGFDILWRYFAWANQTISIFAFAMIAVYMMKKKQPYILALVPGMFYSMVISTFILNATIGFNLSWSVSYIVGAIFTVLYAIFVIRQGKKQNIGTIY